MATDEDGTGVDLGRSGECGSGSGSILRSTLDLAWSLVDRLSLAQELRGKFLDLVWISAGSRALVELSSSSSSQPGISTAGMCSFDGVRDGWL